MDPRPALAIGHVSLRVSDVERASSALKLAKELLDAKAIAQKEVREAENDSRKTIAERIATGRVPEVRQFFPLDERVPKCFLVLPRPEWWQLSPGTPV